MAAGRRAVGGIQRPGWSDERRGRTAIAVQQMVVEQGATIIIIGRK
jgi:hypothetical protein